MQPLIHFTIITLFPEAIRPYLDSSMLFKAQDRGILEVDYVNLRDFGLGPHRSVDDTPYGAGDGMLLRCEPVFAAIESIKSQDPTAEVILPTPVGQIWNQTLARAFAARATSASQPVSTPDQAATQTSDQAPDQALTQAPATPHFIILCPHYEGYDQRILTIVDHPISLGQYILTGGELPALIIIDSVTRLLPGVLGGATSAAIESFSDGDNLEYPQYTKPADFRGLKVPDVLLSGDHGKIAAWRAAHSTSAHSTSTSAHSNTPAAHSAPTEVL